MAKGEFTVDNPLQRIQARTRPVNLPSSMFANYGLVDTELHCLLRVPNVLDALDAERLPARDLLPRLHQPRHLLPRMHPTMPHLVDPLGARLIGLLLRVYAVLGQPLLMDGVTET